MLFYKLINSRTKKEVNLGDVVETFRGEKGVLKWKETPQHVGSMGRVGVQLEFDNFTNSWFPGVIDAEWVEMVREEVK